jgi:hypothetical protein
VDADQRAPPAGEREPRPLRPDADDPGRGGAGQEELGACERDQVGQDHAGQLGEARIASPQRPHHRRGGRRHRRGRDQRRADELAQMGPQPLLDHALHQHEDADRDDKARPGAEVEQERPARRRAERVPP